MFSNIFLFVGSDPTAAALIGAAEDLSKAEVGKISLNKSSFNNLYSKTQ
jgi:hypothetical protein